MTQNIESTFLLGLSTSGAQKPTRLSCGAWSACCSGLDHQSWPVVSGGYFNPLWLARRPKRREAQGRSFHICEMTARGCWPAPAFLTFRPRAPFLHGFLYEGKSCLFSSTTEHRVSIFPSCLRDESFNIKSHITICFRVQSKVRSETLFRVLVLETDCRDTD